MRTNTRRRDQGLALAVLTVVLGLPELAQAQQTGLFPLAPIKRQRVPCDQEDPIYKTYKHQYFGYHPTCWRKFPDGWGCPSREAPNKEESFKKIPLLSGGGSGEEPPTNEDRSMEPGAPGMRPPVPNPPEGGRSPFELDTPGVAPATPRRNPPSVPDPFETPSNPPTGTGQPRANTPPQAGSPPLSENDVPDLSAPEDQPRRSQAARSAQRDDDDQPASADAGDAPLLALPNISVPTLDPSGAVASANTAASSGTTGAAPAPRRGLISGFFNNLGWNWTRR